MVLAVFGEDIGTMTALADHALALNPSSVRGWYHSGFLRLMAGKLDRAIELAEVSLRLSPRARIGGVHTVIGASHLLSRRFDDARGKLLLALEETPNFPVPYRYLAACYANMGQLAEARDVVTRCAMPSTASFTCRVCAWQPARGLSSLAQPSRRINRDTGRKSV